MERPRYAPRNVACQFLGIGAEINLQRVARRADITARDLLMMPVDLALHYLRRGQGDLALEHGRQPARLPLDQRDRRPDRLDQAGEEQAGPVGWQHAAVEPHLPVVLDSENLGREEWEFRLVAR